MERESASLGRSYTCGLGGINLVKLRRSLMNNFSGGHNVGRDVGVRALSSRRPSVLETLDVLALQGYIVLRLPR